MRRVLPGGVAAVMVTAVARSPCLLCGCQLSSYAFLSVRVNRRSLRQLPGGYLRSNPGRCPECGTGSHGSPPAPYAGELFTASLWRLDGKSWAEVQAYRARKWPVSGLVARFTQACVAYERRRPPFRFVWVDGPDPPEFSLP